MVRIGILALQGAFAEHVKCIRQLGAEPVFIRLPRELERIDGLILPGGESTAIGRLLERYRFVQPLRRIIRLGVPIYGTCAGMILLARKLEGEEKGNGDQRLKVMNVVVRRNAFGRQLESFEEYVQVDGIRGEPFRAVFIRAPIIVKAGIGVHVWATLKSRDIVAAEQKNLLVTAFHPELTTDCRIHAYFLDRVTSWKEHHGDRVPARTSF
jgi:5'-phosphate synthase pdxT subunit